MLVDVRIGLCDAFELWCWRRLLRVLWTARRSNQSILKEINSEYSFERLMLKLKLQYSGYLLQRINPSFSCSWVWLCLLAQYTPKGKPSLCSNINLATSKIYGNFYWMEWLCKLL